MPRATRRFRKLWAAAITVALAVAIAGGGLAWLFGGGDQTRAGQADPNDPARVALGRTVYQQQCATCHGVKLQGQPNWRERKSDGKLPAPPHDATGHTWHHPDAQLFAITKHGVKPPLAPEGYESDMRAFGDALTDEEIWAVLGYIKSTWPPDIRERQALISRQAEQ